MYMTIGDIFVEVRQQVAAFNYYCDFYKTDKDKLVGDDMLDEAYRMLNTMASYEFIEYCADREGMDMESYCEMLDIDPNKLYRKGRDS